MKLKNPYLNEFGKTQPPFQTDGSGGWDRKDLIRRYSHSIPSAEAIEAIAAATKSVVEIGAGNGYWAYLLSQLGVDVVAFDSFPEHSFWLKQWFPVKEGDSTVSADFPDRALMMVWPCTERQNSMASEALKAYEGQTVIYVGEPRNGLTAGVDFFNLLDVSFEVADIVWLPRWDIYFDHLAIYEKK